MTTHAHKDGGAWRQPTAAVDAHARAIAVRYGHDLGRWRQPPELTRSYTARAICRRCNREMLLTRPDASGVVSFEGGAAFRRCGHTGSDNLPPMFYAQETPPLMRRIIPWLKAQMRREEKAS